MNTEEIYQRLQCIQKLEELGLPEHSPSTWKRYEQEREKLLQQLEKMD